MAEFKMNLSAYMTRLGIDHVPAPTEENLVKLTRAHLEMVPFENLEVYLEGRIPSMEPEGLYCKVVEQHRGGWCFELNKLFYLLLKELGYSCRPVPSRIVHHRADEVRAVSHRATVVEVEGRLWFCDVGFGGAGPKGAIRMDTAEVQTVNGDTFRVEPFNDFYIGEHTVSRCDDGWWEQVLVFRDHGPWLEPDFTALSTYYATWPRSPFRLKPVLYRCTCDGWISLTGSHLTRLKNGQKQEQDLTNAQMQTVIAEDFCLDYNILS